MKLPKGLPESRKAKLPRGECYFSTLQNATPKLIASNAIMVEKKENMLENPFLRNQVLMLRRIGWKTYALVKITSQVLKEECLLKHLSILDHK